MQESSMENLLFIRDARIDANLQNEHFVLQYLSLCQVENVVLWIIHTSCVLLDLRQELPNLTYSCSSLS
jgi:hypothetical protein